MSYIYPDSPTCCSTASAELKLYQAFIFSVPIFFTLILLFLFYLFYLRRRRVDWSSLRMRTSYQNREAFSRPSELGLKKELREMLPVIVFKESFFVKDTQCSVCLVDYQAEDRLQQIPACGHTFHMDCIDHWLATHTTCPLCRFSLLPAAKTTSGTSDDQSEAQDNEAQSNEEFSGLGNGDGISLQTGMERERMEDRGSYCDSSEVDFSNARRELEGCGCSGEVSVFVTNVETPGSVEQETI